MRVNGVAAAAAEMAAVPHQAGGTASAVWKLFSEMSHLLGFVRGIFRNVPGFGVKCQFRGKWESENAYFHSESNVVFFMGLLLDSRGTKETKGSFLDARNRSVQADSSTSHEKDRLYFAPPI